MQIQPKPAYARRSFIGGGAAATLGIALSGTLGPIARASGADHGSTNGAEGGFDGYGPLQPDPAGLLRLPNGFHYTVVAATGVTLMESGRSDAEATRTEPRASCDLVGTVSS